MYVVRLVNTFYGFINLNSEGLYDDACVIGC